ncbi:MAG TPA: RRXRR domain-containing protein, partial [Candidatus Paceibacterota bacterium]|nr:RRXRR domain-containing protein [Candidatus Paceibacterota bacterium]
LRRTRRGRLWNRPARWGNREHSFVSHGRWIHPTFRSHLAAHLKLIRFLRKRYQIDAVVVEAGQFDAHALKEGHPLQWWEYQKGETYGYKNLKAYVRARDNYTCAYCGKKAGIMTVDHILPQSRFPHLRRCTDNMVCACRDCNSEKAALTAEEYGCRGISDKVKERDRKFLREATGMNYLNTIVLDWLCRGKLYVEEEEQGQPVDMAVGTTRGFVTKADRENIGWPKSHAHDAVAIATNGQNTRLPTHYLAMRWMGRPNRQRNKEQKEKGGNLNPRIANDELVGNGATFHRGDYVEYRGKNKRVRGFIQSLMSKGSARLVDIFATRLGTWTVKKMVKIADSPRLRYEMRSSGELKTLME